MLSICLILLATAIHAQVPQQSNVPLAQQQAFQQAGLMQQGQFMQQPQMFLQQQQQQFGMFPQMGMAPVDYLYANCRGVMCQSITRPSLKYYSCDLIQFGMYSGSQCGPDAVPTQDCVGVTCMKSDGQTTYNSCDLIARGFDGRTCASGSVPIQQRRPALSTANSQNCEGITCVHAVTGMQQTYTSCALMQFGFSGKVCGLGYRPMGSCGPDFYNATCAPGLCCSSHGYCGSDSNYCNAQSLNSSSGAPYNTVNANTATTNLYNAMAMSQFPQQGQYYGWQPNGQVPYVPQATFNGQQTPYNGQQIPYNGQQMPFNGQQIPLNGQQMPFPVQQMQQFGSQLPFNGQQVPLAASQIPLPGQQFPVNGVQVPLTGTQQQFALPGQQQTVQQALVNQAIANQPIRVV